MGCVSLWIHLLSSCCSLLDLALCGHGFHGLAHGLLVSQELHGLDGLQVLVQLVDDGDAGGQVQLHNGGVRHAWCGGGGEGGEQERESRYIQKYMTKTTI